jgi:hypothetical protein
MDMKQVTEAPGLPEPRSGISPPLPAPRTVPTTSPRTTAPPGESPVAIGQRSSSTSALRFDIQRISLPRSYTRTQRERFTTALTAALTQLASQQPAGQVAGITRIPHLEAGRLREGATPEEAALKIAVRILASLHNTTQQAPRGAAGATPHV